MTVVHGAAEKIRPADLAGMRICTVADWLQALQVGVTARGSRWTPAMATWAQ